MEEPEPRPFKKNPNIDKLHKDIKAQWIDIHANDTSLKIKEILANTSLIDGMSQGSHGMFMIFDTLKFDVVYIGSNLEEFSGYTEADIKHERVKFFFKVLHFGHLGFFGKMLEFLHFQKYRVPAKAKAEFGSLSICGLRVRHKLGHYAKILIRAYTLDILPDGMICINLLHFQNVTNLMKSDDYWIRGVFGNDRSHKFSYLSAGFGRQTKGDLFTEREMEILRMIAEGMPTSEIAEKLFLSPATIEKHRKNMIARLGARDTIALTEICKKAGIL